MEEEAEEVWERCFVLPPRSELTAVSLPDRPVLKVAALRRRRQRRTGTRGRAQPDTETVKGVDSVQLPQILRLSGNAFWTLSAAKARTKALPLLKQGGTLVGLTFTAFKAEILNLVLEIPT